MGTKSEPGVIPRAVNDLFTYIEEHPGREFLLRVSYMEIYKEKIHDLIAKADGLTPEIHEDKKRGVFVKNLREVIVVSPQQVLDVIKEGEANRHVGETDYNARSSRSHTIFQMVIESRNKNVYVPDQGSVRISQLNLIDLAGSEKAASDSERRQEGSYINKSLLALGNVISQLTNPKSSGNDKAFVQYRTSILTRVLQTALSGNARISVICTINPTWKCKTESTMTLRFAQRAKMIRTAAKMTRINEHSELQKCLNTIAELQTRMQEKTEQEVETRGRLNQLLGMILTSSKTSATTTAAVTKLADQVANGSGPLSRETIHDVFTQCEQGLTAHREEMAQMQASLEAANKEKRELEARLQMMTKASEEDRQQLEERLAASIKDAKEHEQEFLTRLQVLQEENRYLEANLATSQQAKAEHQEVMTQQLTQLQDENRQLEKSLKLALSDAEQHDNELATHLQNALDASKAENAELKSQLDSLKMEKDQAAAQLAEAQHLRTEFKTACEERDAYLAEIQEQRERTQELTGRMASLENARMLLLDKQEELMHVINKQQSDNEELQADLEEAQKRLEESSTYTNNTNTPQEPPRPRRSLNASFGGSIVPNLMAAAAVYYAATLL
ncbi:kinesin family member 11 [Lichtheimia corymbifera JMRC:FSU:9682]|uniref:Kinesin-like protein n=1 Tax=Lichtheimia corymbifera JMRC:FSU:9682 TaxID=1263082 RepID=A0A068RK20_9FUNG|nr:kinesin family member 11 [Lichtheimia corymbifera JMRC:FSU:9682]